MNKEMNHSSAHIQSSDKRFSSRLNVHYLTDIYLHDEIIYSTVVDISESGIGMVVPHRLYLGEELRLKMNCSLTDQAEENTEKIDIPLVARVIWNREEPGTKLYRVGLEIEQIARDAMDRLQEHINSLNSRS
jgi:hypothetical protein